MFISKSAIRETINFLVPSNKFSGAAIYTLKMFTVTLALAWLSQMLQQLVIGY